jgi:hypothetical protein
VEHNGMDPHLELILMFGSKKEGNGTVPQNGIFRPNVLVPSPLIAL